jgi:hypothetical protein
MRRAPIFASLLAAGFLFPACTPRERAERHEKNAQKDTEEARENLRDAQKEKIKAAAERAEAYREGRDDDRDIRDRDGRDRDVDRHPVAGRDDDGPTVDRSLRDKLGDGWVVERRGGALMAVRKEPVKREKEFTQNLNAGLRDFREHHKDATIRFDDGELKIRGRFEECDHAAAAADKLADLEGVNRISMDVSCRAK